MSNPVQHTDNLVTIEDVALAAGVSTASVSRALSGSRPVRPETRQRVMAAANELNYRINPLASALRSKVTRTVGMIVPDIVTPFFPAVVKAVEDALHQSGLGLFLCDANESPALEARRLDSLLARSVDGIIISPVDAVKSRAAVAAAARRTPLVQVDRHVNVSTDIVSVDHRRGIQLVLDHLVAQGCSSFAFVTTGGHPSVANERLEAYVHYVRRADRASADPLPHAVVCANDLIAVGVLQAFRAGGIRVPQDVAVTGYDDSTFASVVEPHLTSVRQPLGPLGQEAVRFITSAIESPGLPPRELRLLPELVVRDSSSTLALLSSRRGAARPQGRRRPSVVRSRPS
jgi:LacI family transcriptional regulator